jgi:hypothetical protein
LIFHEKGIESIPLPRKKLRAVEVTMWGRGGPFLSEIVVRFEISKASPKASNPGPRLAVVPGTETATEEDAIDFSLETFFLILI